jgi:hypothetical protein
MAIRDVISLINQMQRDQVVETYAIGGAVGATFYLEPLATLDVDIFVTMRPEPGRLILNPRPMLDYLTSRGFAMEGEYLIVGGWPVQFLPPTGPLVDEALEQAVVMDVDGEPARVFSAEHLAAICLETGRAKDMARLLQFIESGSLVTDLFDEIIDRHGLRLAWMRFKNRFLEGPP